MTQQPEAYHDKVEVYLKSVGLSDLSIKRRLKCTEKLVLRKIVTTSEEELLLTDLLAICKAKLTVGNIVPPDGMTTNLLFHVLSRFKKA